VKLAARTSSGICKRHCLISTLVRFLTSSIPHESNLDERFSSAECLQQSRSPCAKPTQQRASSSSEKSRDFLSLSLSRISSSTSAMQPRACCCPCRRLQEWPGELPATPPFLAAPASHPATRQQQHPSVIFSLLPTPPSLLLRLRPYFTLPELPSVSILLFVKASADCLLAYGSRPPV